MLKHLCLVSFAFIMLNCAHIGGERKMASLESSYLNIETLGASNTTGCGASVPLLARIRDHLDLSVINSDLQRQLSQPHTLIAGDYFFPTNYSFLIKANENQQRRVQALLDQWMQQYDLVLVGLLPLWEDLNENEIAVARNFDHGGFKNILDILENYKVAVKAVNRTLQQNAQRYPQKLKLLSLKNMITVSWDYYNNTEALHAFPIPGNAFHPDKLHFTDLGQAFFLNTVVFPVLNPQIPPIVETGTRISNRSMLRALNRILDSRAQYLRGVDGGYWSTFIDSSQFATAKAQIANGDAQDMAPIMKIVNVIDKNATTRAGFPIYIRFHTEPQKVSLDLSSALFYTLIDLNKTVDGVFEGWGYDYWMSANLLNPMNPPKVNYHFVLKKTNTEGLFDLEWTLYPMLAEQATWLNQNYQTEMIRLSSISPAHIQKLKSQTGHFVKYSLQVRIQDL